MRCPPAATWDKWVAQFKKKKKLKAFKNTDEDEENQEAQIVLDL